MWAQVLDVGGRVTGVRLSPHRDRPEPVTRAPHPVCKAWLGQGGPVAGRGMREGVVCSGVLWAP